MDYWENEDVERLIEAAKNALVRLDREDATRRAEGRPAAQDGVLGSVNDQLRVALRECGVNPPLAPVVGRLSAAQSNMPDMHPCCYCHPADLEGFRGCGCLCHNRSERDE